MFAQGRVDNTEAVRHDFVFQGPLMSTPDRPLSPHLQIYRPQLTSVLSITHRATGVFLSFGAVALVYWLVAVAGGEESYLRMQAVLGSFPGRLLLFAWTFSFFYHLCNGIRHLCWDAGLGFELSVVYVTGWAVVVVAATLTIATWVAAVAL